jgi:hypothetical protein
VTKKEAKEPKIYRPGAQHHENCDRNDWSVIITKALEDPSLRLNEKLQAQ